MTISAFQGVGSIVAPMNLAMSSDKGLFVLAATSNPEAARIQRAQVSPTDDDDSEQTLSVARAIIEDVTRYNATQGTGDVGSIGVVLGATLDFADYGIDIADPRSPALPVLAPGFGHQGAQFADAPRIYGALLHTAIVSESRTVLSAGPAGIADEIARRREEMSAAIG